MSNVIIIEDDDRVTREISNYIRELGDDHKVRTFKSAEQFIKRYTKTITNKDLAGNELREGFAAYSSEQLKQLDDLELSSSLAFPGNIAKLRCKSPSLTPIKIELSEKGPLFLKEENAVIENDKFFEQLIHPSFKETYVNFLKTLVKKNNGDKAQIVLPFKNENAHWIVQMRVTKLDSEFFEVTLEDINATEKGKGAIRRELNNREGGSAKELDLLSSIHLIIFKNGLIEIDTPEWVTATRNHLQNNEFFPEEGSPRFIVTKYEDDGIPKSKLFHPHIDDLITLPLDRLLFLQKVDIILTLPEMKKPRYLFLQPVEQEIEVSKKTKLDSFNDVSISITNPIALRPGLASTFFFRFPNDDDPIRVVTKSAESRKHPDDPTLFIATFDYFGIPRQSQIRIKGYLRGINEYKEILNFNEEDFAYHPENIFLTDEQKRVKTAVVLDSDEQVRKQIKNALLENMQQMRVAEESSYYLFEKKYLLAEDEESIPLKEHEIYDKKVAWKVDAKTLKLTDVVNEPMEEDLICGTLAKDYFSGPNEWKFLFEEGHNQDLILENLSSIKMKEEKSLLVDIKHADGSHRLAQVSLRHDINKIELCVSTPDPDALKGDVLESVDVLIMNVRMLPTEFEHWYQDVNDRINKMYLNVTGKPIKILAFADAKKFDEEKLNWLLEKKIDGLILSPIDTKVLCYHISKITNNTFTRYCPENLGSYTVGWPAYVAKKATLISISEFGCTVRSKKPLRIGTTVFLHGFIYEKAPGKNLCARMYYCEPDKKEEGYFICYFIYFGISDSFLKFTRNWIRENYAQQKSKTT